MLWHKVLEGTCWGSPAADADLFARAVCCVVQGQGTSDSSERFGAKNRSLANNQDFQDYYRLSIHFE